MRKKLLVAAGAALSGLILAVPVPASAAAASPTVKVLSTGVIAPFNLALSHARVYVADGATAQVSRLRRDGSLKLLAQAPQPGDVAGVDVSRNGRYLAFTASSEDHSVATLDIWGPQGSRTSADLAGYEKTVNPDSVLTYGTDSQDPCVIETAKQFTGLPPEYAGIADAHPYSVASYGKSWIVADAGGNDLVRVNAKGHISTVAVLPAQPLTFTADIVKNLGLPDCLLGVTYKFESVPTDVEVGRDGYLYVTTLAGGPEDPSVGARSSVYRVNPYSGKVKLIATGLAGATNLAIGRHGTIYVSEFYAGRISMVKNGKVTPYVDLPNAVSVEACGDDLYAGTLAAFGQDGATGSLVKISRGRRS